jgi:sec-independent protein translocase protein TatA
MKNYSIVPLFIGTLGVPELLIILAICILLFGAKKVPQLLKGVGESVREFKGALRQGNEAADEAFEGLDDELDMSKLSRRERRRLRKLKNDG